MNETIPPLETLPPNPKRGVKRDLPFEAFGREIQKVSLEWTAGFIDGEGSFGIYRAKYAGKKREPYYYGRITCTNTDRLTVECLKHTYGGCVTTTGAGKTNWKPGWRWILNGYDAMDLNEILYKKFVTKADHARLFRAFCKYRYANTPLVLETCHRYKLKLQALNRRGTL